MGYYLNPAELTAMFAVPSSVVDKHIKLASSEQLKVLLWALRNANDFDSTAAAEALRITPDAATEAFDYWVGVGVLGVTESPAPAVTAAPKAAPKKAIASSALKPNREEAAKRGLECPEIAFILHSAEQKFGRMLRQTEISTLVWLFDDQGLSASLILMIIEFAISEGRANIGFIERTAIEWVNDGVLDVESAERRLIDMRRKKSAWHIVETTMGIEHRSPSKAELETADKWITEWGYGRDIIRAAYELCVDTTSKFSFAYIKKIMEGWHKEGVKTLDDIENIKVKKNASNTNNNNNKYDDFMKKIIFKEGEY